MRKLIIKHIRTELNIYIHIQWNKSTSEKCIQGIQSQQIYADYTGL